MHDNKIDFVVGCGYKFLNGGPGAPAFVYVRDDLQAQLRQPLSGWMGHRDPFAFGNEYQPAHGIDRILAGTPNILSLTALNSALDVYTEVKPKHIFAKAQTLTNFFMDCVASTCEDFEISIITPEVHGAQVSLTHPEAYPISQALIAAGIICDFRAPNIIRFGFSPMYISYREVITAANHLQNILTNETFKQAQFQQGGKVT